ncbi:MAG: WYL domain-containing protein [Gammaproteobacteria bacterium]|nr:WYL domain-containing protein [Gammaproteobacteria bacterium]MDH5630475.1 WYL domain-containing protein [Gammaproteobacteria bacterium]
MNNSKWPFSWELILRYRYIEIIALWEGRLTSKSLINAFGIGRQQASKYINNYINSISKTNLIYDKQLKGYRPTENFNPVLTNGEISEYLQLLNQQDDLMSIFNELNLNQPNTHILQSPTRSLSANIIQPIIEAARDNKRVDIRYLSMTSPQPKERIISPHTIIFNGHRWHIRAYCEDQQDFRDFVLSRITEVYDIEGDCIHMQNEDIAWNTFVDIVIKPDPRLNNHQQKIIERDYSMTNGKRSFKIRGALVTYFLQLLNLDYQQPHNNPKIQQIIVSNIDDLKLWRF